MQDKYVGDIGDFGKYILLNEILVQAKKQSIVNIRLGLNWYYTTINETGNADGKHTAYLSEENSNHDKFKKCSPILYEVLGKHVSENKRTIAAIEANKKILPEETIFYSEPIPHIGTTAPKRIAAREKWHKDSISQLNKADIIFFDPDNGIHLDTSIKSRAKSVKYIFQNEIESYFKLGKTVVVYNHRDRSKKQKYGEKILSATEFVQPPNDVMILRFKRYSVRDYIFLIQDHDQELINHTFNSLTKAPFDFLFERYSF